MAKEKTSAKTGKDKTGKTGAGKTDKTDKSGKIPIPLKDNEDVKPPLAETTEAPVIENEQPINAAWAINLALHYKEDIAGSNVSPEVIEKEVYGEGGIMETLKSYRPKLPSDKLEEFDQILSAIDGLVKFKKSPPLTEQQPPVGQKAEPAAPVAPKLSAKERLQLEFGKVSKALKEFKETRICHPQHVFDFCKQSSAAGFEFTYDAAENKLKGSFLGEKESCDFVLGT